MFGCNKLKRSPIKILSVFSCVLSRNDYFILLLYSKQDVSQFCCNLSPETRSVKTFLFVQRNLFCTSSLAQNEREQGEIWPMCQTHIPQSGELCQGPVQSLPGWVREGGWGKTYVGCSVGAQSTLLRSIRRGVVERQLLRTCYKDPHLASSLWEQGTTCCCSKFLPASVTVCHKHTYSECTGVQSTRQGNAFWGMYEQLFSLLSLFIIWFWKGGGQ